MKKSTILIIIDAQVGLLRGGEGIVNVMQIIANINLLIAKARDLNVPILFVQDSDVGGPGSLDWQIDSGLNFKKADLFVEKSFCDAFFETNLKSCLDNYGATHLIVTGFRTEYCVDTTVRRAPSEGFSVTLVSDGHGTKHNAGFTAQQIVDYHNIILHEFGVCHGDNTFEVTVAPANLVVF